MASVKSASDLYGLPLDQFTPERNELVKRLKADGEKDEATRVAKLRKPSTAAWAVNQLVRTQKKTIAELFKTGDQMLAAQSKAVSGKGSAEALKAATQKQRQTTAKLLEAAQGLLSSEGHELPAGVQERVSETLRAAAVDPDSREQVKSGCLAKELQFTGLAGFGAGASSTSSTSSAAEDKQERQRAEELKAAQDREKAARHELSQAKRQLAKVEKELADADRRRKRAERDVEAAEQAASQAGDRRKQLQRGAR